MTEPKFAGNNVPTDQQLLHNYFNGQLDAWSNTFTKVEDKFKRAYLLGREHSTNDEIMATVSEKELLEMLRNGE